MTPREHKENFRDAIWDAVRALESVSGGKVSDMQIHQWITAMEQAITGETFWGNPVSRENGGSDG